MAACPPHTSADVERCYRAVKGRDRRFDGVFYTAVRTTGIYCRPSCPATTPRRPNVVFFVSAAAAQLAGYRACRRCLPDATPGSPEWDVRADVAGRAMRLINDGVVERDGVSGLARRIGYTPRHWAGCSPTSRCGTARPGPGPPRPDRAHPGGDHAAADGRHRLRVGLLQRPAVQRHRAEVYACTPTELRGRRRHGGTPTPGRLDIRLAVRRPFDGGRLLAFLAARAVPGLEVVAGGTYSRTLALPHGPAVVHLTPREDVVACALEAADLRDVGAAVERCRRLLDLDADPAAVDDLLGADPVLGPTVRAHPGLRVPGHVDGLEVAVRAVVGQQISVSGARTILARLVAAHGAALGPTGRPGRTGWAPRSPTPRRWRGSTRPRCRCPAAAGAPWSASARPSPTGRCLDRSAARAEVRARLLALPGIGPWTADYILLRSLGDPDVFLPTDVGVRHGLTALGSIRLRQSRSRVPGGRGAPTR